MLKSHMLKQQTHIRQSLSHLPTQKLEISMSRQICCYCGCYDAEKILLLEKGTRTKIISYRTEDKVRLQAHNTDPFSCFLRIQTYEKIPKLELALD